MNLFLISPCYFLNCLCLQAGIYNFPTVVLLAESCSSEAHHIVADFHLFFYNQNAGRNGRGRCNLNFFFPPISQERKSSVPLPKMIKTDVPANAWICQWVTVKVTKCLEQWQCQALCRLLRAAVKPASPSSATGSTGLSTGKPCTSSSTFWGG